MNIKPEREYVYLQSDFKELTIRPQHMHLVFDVFSDHTHVTASVTYRVTGDNVRTLTLNAQDLTIESVELLSFKTETFTETEIDQHLANAERCQLTYQMDDAQNLLHIELPQSYSQGTLFHIQTQSQCRPTSNVLEGIYYDFTPEGAPPQQITQCQQWGFQRIVPCLDYMNAKCRYTTEIIADERYTTLLSNGDLHPDYHDQGEVALKKEGKERVRVIYRNHKTPMATYLFFLACGTYDTFSKKLEYPDGRCIRLELLVPPGSDQSQANIALDALHDSIIWVNLHTGPDKYKHEAKRHRVENLMAERDALTVRDMPSKEDLNQLETLRSELKGLLDGWRLGYQYTGDIYREIAMENSDFGGMENVGNTTILTNRIMPFAQMTDTQYEYMESVKVHEFYHNLNGSEVTGHSPFEIWLNEAVTVYIERERHAAIFGDDYSRVDAIEKLYHPLRGALTLDTSPTTLPIQPPGFNRPHELITAVTYNKAPELVNMIKTMMGKEKFVEGLHLYHTRYRHANATTRQWIEAMEETSGLALQQMADGFLKRPGFPTLSVTTQFSAGCYKIKFSQSGHTSFTPDLGPWTIPITYALLDANGKGEEKTLVLSTHEQTVEISSLAHEPAVLSVGRNFSFYGKTTMPQQTDDNIALQVEIDNDPVKRYLAMKSLFDRDVHARINGKSTLFCKTWETVLERTDLNDHVKSQLLRIDDVVDDHDIQHLYDEVYHAANAIKKELMATCGAAIRNSYDTLHAANKEGPHKDQLSQRALKNELLPIMVTTGHADDLKRCRRQLFESPFSSDKIAAFQAYLESDATDSNAVVTEIYTQWKKHPLSLENFIHVIAGSSCKNTGTYIETLLADDAFRIELAGHARGLLRAYAVNCRRNLLQEDGFSMLIDLIIRIAKVNQMSAISGLGAFRDFPKHQGVLRQRIEGGLKKILASLDSVKHASITNNVGKILSQ